MDSLKRQEIKNLMISLWESYQDKVELAKHVMYGYINGTYASNEHYPIDVLYYEIVAEIQSDIDAAQPVVLNADWWEANSAKRVVLSDEAVKEIAINALSLIQYVQANGLTIENVPGSARVYVNYINEEDQAVFEQFGGVVEDNPYPTTDALSAMTVAQLDAYYGELSHEIEGWGSMLKAEKITALTTLIYG
jgi:hypothetical protein